MCWHRIFKRCPISIFLFSGEASITMESELMKIFQKKKELKTKRFFRTLVSSPYLPVHDCLNYALTYSCREVCIPCRDVPKDIKGTQRKG